MRRTWLFIVVLAMSALTALDARPNRYGHSDREERHMFPAVSSGPLDPAWSPDGQWIAFSMRGDIWKIPAAGGEAIQLTVGPAYHFEPAWSPDGARIAFSYDDGAGRAAFRGTLPAMALGAEGPGNLRIGVVSASGGREEPLISAPGVNIQPAWSRDGKALFFTSARAGGFRIFRHDLATNEDVNLVNGIQAAPSPDGKLLAYEQGGLRVFDLTTRESKLIRAEETEYRMEPAWTPDGQSLVYVTEDGGSNDIRLISANGGEPLELTTDRTRHEMSPSVSPDGARVAFVQFDAAVPTLYTMPIAGGRASAWTKVPITSRKSVTPTGRVRIRVLDEKGQDSPARIYIDASDGRHYTPDGLFHRSMMDFDRHYFHMDAAAEVELPSGNAVIEAMHGFEYLPARTEVTVTAGVTATATLRLTRAIDLPARGWYSGDSHVHDLHQGFGLTHEAFFRQLKAEDINITHALIHMDGTRIMGRWEDLTGAPSPLSTPNYILQYAEEFRGGLGHIGMMGLKEFVLPFTTASGGNTPYGQYSLDTPYLEGARAQGGLAGFMHPYTSAPKTPQAAAATLIGLDAALGLGDYYDIGALYSDERGSADFYYRLLNAGFHLPATGGTDNFSDVWLDPPPGSDRTFAHLDGPLTMANWMASIKKERTFFSNGPILLLTVDGREPGDEIRLAAGAPSTVRVKVEAISITPLDSLEIVVNGHANGVKPDEQLPHSGPYRLTLENPVEIPSGGWVAARASGPKSIYLGDDYAFAQTSPVYVVRDGKKYVNPDDVQFLADTMDAIWARVERTRWRSDAEKDAFKAAVDKAKAYYLRLK